MVNARRTERKVLNGLPSLCILVEW